MAIDAFRKNYLQLLAENIRDRSLKDDVKDSLAAQYIIADKLGYEVSDDNFIDGAGDRGIDFWFASDKGLYVHQVKTHNLTDDGLINEDIPFNNSGITDLMRAKNYLLSDEPSTRLHKIKIALNHLMENHKSQEVSRPIPIVLRLIILGKNLTSQATQELDAFRKSLLEPIIVQDIQLEFHMELITIEEIISSGWREENREWIDIQGKKRKSIFLEPMRQADRKHYINDDKSAIFYCKAYDLVVSYQDFGYQIFEPNVRANIKNSKVNYAIRESASYRSSMRDFRFLNNGITITCKSYKKPSGQRSSFEVVEPGVINGLQTVTSIYTAYQSLSSDNQVYFKDNCYVFVRILTNDAVDNIEEVVLATNNQNPMQLRNLVSNYSEQVQFAKWFANEINWFYEAKQGAWDAFKSDPRRWRPSINKAASHFKAKSGYKKVDNHELAQDWLAFIGFSQYSSNDKKYLFEKEYYTLIFMRRTNKHAYKNYSSINDALDDSNSIINSPDPRLMLLAHITRQFASKVVPSTQMNKKQTLERNNKNGILSLEEEERIFSGDSEYILNQALKSMSLIFVEFVGYTLFEIFNKGLHDKSRKLLSNHSWHILTTTYDIDSIVKKAHDKNFEENDLLMVMWFVFCEAVQTLINGRWNTAYRNERYKPRFLLNNRHDIYKEIDEMNVVIKRRIPLRIYTSGFREGEGYFDFIKRVIEST